MFFHSWFPLFHVFLFSFYTSKTLIYYYLHIYGLREKYSFYRRLFCSNIIDLYSSYYSWGNRSLSFTIFLLLLFSPSTRNTYILWKTNYMLREEKILILQCFLNLWRCIFTIISTTLQSDCKGKRKDNRSIYTLFYNFFSQKCFSFDPSFFRKEYIIDLIEYSIGGEKVLYWFEFFIKILYTCFYLFSHSNYLSFEEKKTLEEMLS